MSKTVKNFLNSREHMKNQMLDYLCIALGLMFYTIGWTCFLLPYKIVTGALTGLSAIVFYVTGIPIYQTYLTLNVVMLIAALKILGLRFLLKTIYAIVLLSTMLTLAQSWMTGADGQMIQILGAGNTFMALIIGTMFTGSGLAIVDRPVARISSRPASTSTRTSRWATSSSASTSASSVPVSSSQPLAQRCRSVSTRWSSASSRC